MQLASVSLAATATPPAFVVDAIQQLDWLHEVVGTLENERVELIDLDELDLGIGYASHAAALLEQGGAVAGFDTAAAAQAAHGVEHLVGTARSLIAGASDPTEIEDRVMDLGSKADVLVHDAYRALGIDRD